MYIIPNVYEYVFVHTFVILTRYTIILYTWMNKFPLQKQNDSSFRYAHLDVQLVHWAHI